jgi:hypothetical protein
LVRPLSISLGGRRYEGNRGLHGWCSRLAILGVSFTILDETVAFLALPSIDPDPGTDWQGQQSSVNAYLLARFVQAGIGNRREKNWRPVLEPTAARVD